MTITIRPPIPDDFDVWQVLFEGYCEFYNMPTDIEHRKVVWGWLFDAEHVTECRLALDGGKPVGFIHFRAMPSQLRGCEVGFLDDLFVKPDLRGRGIAITLLAALDDIAKERGWPTTRWLTAENNYQGRTLYDKVGEKTPFILYQM